MWVDKRVLLRHTGTFTFDAVAQDRIYFDLKAIADAKAAEAAAQTPTDPAGA